MSIHFSVKKSSVLCYDNIKLYQSLSQKSGASNSSRRKRIWITPLWKKFVNGLPMTALPRKAGLSSKKYGREIGRASCRERV